MLYVSKYDTVKDRYGVTDTDDNVTQFIAKEKLLDIVNRLGVVVRGVSGDTITVVSMKNNTDQQSLMRHWVTKAKTLGIMSDFVFSHNYTKLIEYRGSSVEIVIPPVKVIGKDCFSRISNALQSFAGSEDTVGRLKQFGVGNEGPRYKFTMPETVEVIEEQAFANVCASCNSVFNTKNVKVLGNGAFRNFDVDGELFLSFPNVEVMGEAVFSRFGCYNKDTGLDDIQANFEQPHTGITGLLFGNKVSRIPDFCCDGLTSLETVQFGNIIEYIGISAFSCTSLRNIVLPDSLLCIRHMAFSKCCYHSHSNYGIALVIPERVSEIQQGAFAQCECISILTINAKQCQIDVDAFRSCDNLMSVVAGGGTLVLGNDVFLDCTNLEVVGCQSRLESVGRGIFEGCTSLRLAEFSGGAYRYSDSMFLGCSALTAVSMQEGLVEIEDNCFMSCRNLKAISIPSSVTRIGARAFIDCLALLDVTIPATVVDVGDGAFSIGAASGASRKTQYTITYMGENFGEDCASGRVIFAAD